MDNALDYLLKEQQEQIIELQDQKQSLLKNIDDLIANKKVQEQKNKALQKQIDELRAIMKHSEEQLEKTRQNSTLADIKIEPKIYLKGMFDSFIPEKNALKIMIEGSAYYYPLSSYQSIHLPVSGSRVLIFKNEEGKNVVYGFNGAKLIDAAQQLKAVIKFISVSQNRLKLSIEGMGFIYFYPSEDFWKEMGHGVGDTVLLSKIYIDAKEYFYIANKGHSFIDRNEILHILKEQ